MPHNNWKTLLGEVEPSLLRDESLDYLAPSQRRDVRALEAEAYCSGGTYEDSLSPDYGEVI